MRLQWGMGAATTDPLLRWGMVAVGRAQCEAGWIPDGDGERSRWLVVVPYGTVVLVVSHACM